MRGNLSTVSVRSFLCDLALNISAFDFLKDAFRVLIRQGDAEILCIVLDQSMDLMQGRRIFHAV